MIKNYLKIYNALLAAGWTTYLAYASTRCFQPDSLFLILLNSCQITAVLEIIHALLRWTPSPVFTTTLQIFSRLFVLYWINVIPIENQLELLHINGIVVISLAWSITEIVRYSHYFFSLIGKPVYVLHYLRYTLFIFLYPLGIIGEGMIMISALLLHGGELSVTNIIIALVLLSYIPFFPKLYGYMWSQRKKKLSA